MTLYQYCGSPLIEELLEKLRRAEKMMFKDAMFRSLWHSWEEKGH